MSIKAARTMLTALVDIANLPPESGGMARVIARRALKRIRSELTVPTKG